jgi:hypothetical protein
MPALPTINDVFRVTFEFLSSDAHRANNVLHFRTTGTDAELAATINDVLDNGGSYNPWTALSNSWECSNINVLPLDGSSAGQDYPLSPNIVGDGSGNVLPNCCLLVSLHTSQRGSRGRGRVFVGPVTEDNVSNGVFGTLYAGGVASQWQSFIDDLAAATPAVALVVASYVHSDAHDVLSHRVDLTMATQRRRLDQYRL